jgi:beta-glucuronidase
MKITKSLNGEWDFIADLDPKYHHLNIFNKNDGSLINAQRIPNYAKKEVNRRYWKKVTVPSVWQKYENRYDLFEGVCWYSREFQIDQVEHLTEVWLRFGAVNYKCRVFVNNNEVGLHETGYNEFAFEVRKFVQLGTNHISVMVDNRATETIWPACMGYFNYGGIHRDVTLEFLYDSSLYEPRISSQRTSQGWMLNASGKCITDGSDYVISLSCNHYQIKGNIDKTGQYSIDLLVKDVKPWSPEEPNLYLVQILLTRKEELWDRYETSFGFREIKVLDRQIILNGQSYPLKGICYVFDDPVTGLKMTTEKLLSDVTNMKELGCNIVRCHYSMDRMFYEICDREGLMVWVEPNIYCYHPSEDESNTAFVNPHSIHLAEQMITEMIHTAFNHPSVAIYGIGNECNVSHPEALPFFKNLIEIVRHTDSSRLISYAALYGNVGPLGSFLDVVGINSYWGWYDRIQNAGPLTDRTFIELGFEPRTENTSINLQSMHEMLQKVIETSNKNIVLLLTEFGADSVPGYLSQSTDLWSENYHAALLGEIFQLTTQYPQIVGTFPFCFSDYRDPSKESNGYWNEINLKGVVSYERRKKLSFFAIQHFYKE